MPSMLEGRAGRRAYGDLISNMCLVLRATSLTVCVSTVVAVAVTSSSAGAAALQPIGQFPTEVGNPRGIHVEGHTIWLTGSSNEFGSYIAKYTTDGTLLARWASTAGTPETFPTSPWAITTDGAGRVIVTSSDLNCGESGWCVYVFSPTGELLRVFGSALFNHPRPGALNQPEGVGADSQGYIYVSDSWQGLVFKYSPDGSYIKEWSVPVSFWEPHGIAVDGTDHIYVAQSTWCNSCSDTYYTAYEFDTEGTLLQIFGSDNRGRASSVGVDSQGIVYTDYSTDYIKAFSPTGPELASAVFGSDDFHHAIGVDAQGVVYRGARDAVEKYALETTAPETTITKAPRKRVKIKRRSTRARFRFQSNESPATFTCTLDRGRPKACTSPIALRVKKGKHKFRVASTDDGGITDPTPAKYAWMVQRKRKRTK